VTRCPALCPGTAHVWREPEPAAPWQTCPGNRVVNRSPRLVRRAVRAWRYRGIGRG
jgi:hypothetical protein